MVTRAQLSATGLDANAIEYRLKVGRLHRLHPGVYAVGHVSQSLLASAMAVVLACGPSAAVSHRSAAALWEICRDRDGPVEVIALERHRLRGVRVHRTRTLPATDVTVHLGIPVTTPPRTLLDLAGALDDPTLARVVNEAQVRRRVRREELAALVAGPARRPGVARLRRLIELPTAPTRSAFEDAFLAFVARHGLPVPEVNQRVAGYEVDMLWRRQRLVAELDGRAYHDHGQPFERDRDKDADSWPPAARCCASHGSDSSISRNEKPSASARSSPAPGALVVTGPE